MTPSPSPRPPRRPTEEILDMIDDVLPATYGPVEPPATPDTPVPFSPRPSTAEPRPNPHPAPLPPIG